jgi:predicted  nucleic acid-binding Zn-ribbon protein
MPDLTCANCQTRFDDQLISCPNCGVSKFRNLSPAEPESEAAEVAPPQDVPSTRSSGRTEGATARLLDQAEAAAGRMDWIKVQEYARAALSFEKDNEEAAAFLAAAEANLAGTQEVAVLLSPVRLLVFPVVSAGLYIFYWFYVTWRHLKPVTREDHYPIWHALTLLVPFYSYFRMHRHLEVIQEVNPASLSPLAGVFLLLVASILSWVGAATTDPSAALPLLFISTGLTTLLIMVAQNGLNAGWLQRFSGSSNAPIHPVEVVLALVGVLFWLGTAFPEG